VAEDIASTYLGEFILTDQRVWVRGSPYAWNQSDTMLEDIASMTWRRDAIFMRTKSIRGLQVHMFPEGKQIVKTYAQLTGKNKLYNRNLDQ
jgi:alpha-glucosidase (family GH31 glycosyl hydrolase)